MGKYALPDFKMANIPVIISIERSHTIPTTVSGFVPFSLRWRANLFA